MSKNAVGIGAAGMIIAVGAITSPAASAYQATTMEQSTELVAQVAQEREYSALSLPHGATLREIFRHYNGKRELNATLYFFPQNWDKFGWRMQGSLGFISSTPFENSRPLHACKLNGTKDSYFTSWDVGCEGHFLSSFGLIGYISTVPLPNTQPLYRCSYQFKGRLSHFDTFLANCGHIPNSHNNGPLGYVFL